MPQISVIVPVYNVEKYLKECIDSILAQTFSDFELVLVDDGSTDNSGKICDEYKEIDNRIKVVHKENGGLSDARNAGIKEANGEYITFIDSDDYILPSELSVCIEALQKEKADIVCFGIKQVNEVGEYLFSITSKPRILDGRAKMLAIIGPDSIGDFAVNKIYKRFTFDGVEYPLKMTFEDVATTYKVFDKANKVAMLQNEFYIYRRHNESITRQQIFNDSVCDFIKASERKTDFIVENYNEYRNEAALDIVNSVNVVSGRAFGCEESAEKQKVLNYCRDTLNKYWHLIENNPFINGQDFERVKYLRQDLALWVKYIKKEKQKQKRKAKVQKSKDRAYQVLSKIWHLVKQ